MKKNTPSEKDNDSIRKLKNYFVFLIPVTILLVIKLPHLNLPYFWDEAWSYFPAINEMAKNGPSLLPGAIPINITKGHPQLFLSIGAMWMNFSSGSIFAMRILPMIISIGVLIISFLFMQINTDKGIAILIMLLISSQSLFLAQSSLLLPEMLMSFFLILSLYSFLNERYLLYGLFSTLMVQTKETALIFALIFGIFFLYKILFYQKSKKHWGANLIYVMLPGLFYVLFLGLHYYKFNSFFYSEHLSHVDMNWATITDKLERAFKVIFKEKGRLSITSFLLVFLLINIWKYKSTKNIQENLLILSLILAFILFAAFNFFTLRYMLAPMLLFILMFGINLSNIKLGNTFKYLILIALSCICLRQSITKKKNSDADLGYVEVVHVQKEMVQYCEKIALYDTPLALSFNMIFAIREPELGYRSTKKQFTSISDWKHFDQTKYFIYESTFGGSKEITDYVKNNFTLIKSFENKHAWGYIYRNEHH